MNRWTKWWMDRWIDKWQRLKHQLTIITWCFLWCGHHIYGLNVCQATCHISQMFEVDYLIHVNCSLILFYCVMALSACMEWLLGWLPIVTIVRSSWVKFSIKCAIYFRYVTKELNWVNIRTCIWKKIN